MGVKIKPISTKSPIKSTENTVIPQLMDLFIALTATNQAVSSRFICTETHMIVSKKPLESAPDTVIIYRNKKGEIFT